MKFRKKPVVINALLLNGSNWQGVMAWVGSAAEPWYLDNEPRGLLIKTLEGYMTANFGDYVICGVKGEFYPCKPDIFAATYEPVEEEPA